MSQFWPRLCAVVTGRSAPAAQCLGLKWASFLYPLLFMHSRQNFKDFYFNVFSNTCNYNDFEKFFRVWYLITLWVSEIGPSIKIQQLGVKTEVENYFSIRECIRPVQHLIWSGSMHGALIHTSSIVAYFSVIVYIIIKDYHKDVSWLKIVDYVHQMYIYI